MANEAKVQAYPLTWPVGVPRTSHLAREHAKFGQMVWNSAATWKSKKDRSLTSCVEELQVQVGRLGATDLVISTNLKLRQDGLPRGDQGKPADPGAAVYFTLRKVPYCLPCDKWTAVEDNLWAIAKHIDAMRGMERWGVGSIEQNFMGYKALAAEAGKHEDWRTVLGLGDNATVEQVKAAHRLAAQAAHPDRGGSNAQMSRINTARDRALAEIGGAA